MIIDLEDYVSMQNDIANKSTENQQLRADKARIFAELEIVKRVANDQALQNADMLNVLSELRERYKLSEWITKPIDSILNKYK